MASTSGHHLKATFTFDEITMRHLTNASVQLKKPKSEIVRDAINQYHSRLDRLTDEEIATKLRIIDELGPLITPRPRAEIDRELREIRRARRHGGRRTPV
jgi:hypothetical protein